VPGDLHHDHRGAGIRQTGANLLMLSWRSWRLAAVFVTFVFTTLIHEPASIATLAGILVERGPGHG
jgi:hypothetical protein